MPAMFDVRGPAESDESAPLSWSQPANAPAAAPRPTDQRHFLFVTAPFGDFSTELARLLRRNGAQCRRVLLNGGDLLEWGPRQAIAYRGGRDQWRSWIFEHLRSTGVTDLITHGDSHRYGAEAIAAARYLGLDIHVFEQGYFRPHWVTLERDGVNAHSRLPRQAEHYRRIGVTSPLRPPVPVGRITPAAVRKIVRHQFASFAGWPLFPGFRNPYAYGVIRQAAGHIRRFALQKLFRKQHRRALNRIFDGAQPVFLALLQRPGDSQLTRHSRFESSRGFINHVVGDFAANASSEARLVFKSHPLDHGIEPHQRYIIDAAARAGASDRIFFADDGHFPTLIAKSSGVVTVNSTGGLSAIEAGLPTIVLGDALYDIEGLTHQSGLARFWRSPEPPDQALFEVFRATVMASTQINGAFSTRHGVSLSAPEAARRLLNVHGFQ